jgi:glucose/mannose transport system permease protein
VALAALETSGAVAGTPGEERMGLRWSRIAPQIALVPALLVTLTAFVGAIVWSIYLSFTASRRFPDYELIGFKQYQRLFNDDAWTRSLEDMVVLGVGSLLSIGLGFLLAALIDREVAGKGFFRTVFLYPLAVSLIVTGIIWRWLFNPSFGIENFLHGIGWTSASFNWLASPQTVMYGIILGTVWQSTGFYMALMLAGLRGINSEIWQAARLDGVPFWRLYFEVIIPMMYLTFLTSILLLSIGVVKAYDIIVAMTNGGPGGGSYVPAYFAIQAYWIKSNLGFASAAATIMLLMTALLFLPFLLFRRRAAA